MKPTKLTGDDSLVIPARESRKSRQREIAEQQRMDRQTVHGSRLLDGVQLERDSGDRERETPVSW